MILGIVCSCGTLNWAVPGFGEFGCGKCGKSIAEPAQVSVGPPAGGYSPDDLAIMKILKANLAYQTAEAQTQARATLVLSIFGGVVLGGLIGGFLAFGTHFGIMAGAIAFVAIVALAAGAGWFLQQSQSSTAAEALPLAKAERAAAAAAVQKQNPAFIARMGGVDTVFDDARLNAALTQWILERRNGVFFTAELERI